MLQKIYETNTGKKIEVIFELDPMKWAENELSVLKNFYYNKLVDFLKSILVLFVPILFFFHGAIWLGSILEVLFIVGIGMFFNDMLRARADLKEFQKRIDSNQVEPDMYKSIHAYYGATSRECMEVKRLLELNERIFLDYEVSLDKEDGPCFKITTANIDTGDVRTNEFYYLSVIRNIELKSPVIKITPNGISLRIPIEINEKENLA